MSLPDRTQMEPLARVRDFAGSLRRKWRFALIAGLIVAAYVVVEYQTVSPTYRATFKLRVSSDVPGVSAFAPETPGLPDQRLVQSQCALVSAQPVLEAVAGKLLLAERWSEPGRSLTKAETLSRLANHVSVHPSRERDYLVIEGADSNPALAIDLVNAMADEFTVQSEQYRHDRLSESLDRLRLQVDRQFKVMQSAQQAAATELRQSGGSAPTNGSSAVSATSEQLTRLRYEIDDRRSRLEAIRALQNGGASAAQIVAMLYDDQASRLLDRTREAELELADVRQRYGDAHPSIQRQATALSALQADMNGRIGAILSGMTIELGAREAHLHAMESRLAGTSDQKDSTQASAGAGLYRNAALEADLQTKVYEAMRDRLQKAGIEAELPQPFVQVIERPMTAHLEAAGRLCDMPWVAGGLALVLGLVVARLADWLDTSVKRAADAAGILSAPLLATVQGRPRLLDDEQADHEQIEAYRMVVARLKLTDPHAQMRSLAVVSAVRGEGRSIAVANLACLYAAQGKRVLVIDTDLAGASMHARFDVAPSPGLVDLIDDTATADAVIASTPVPNVWLIPAGYLGAAGSPSPLQISALAKQMDRRFDLVIYDTAPLALASDAAIVARESHFVLQVVRAGSCSRHDLSLSAELLNQAHCTLLGVVYNEQRAGLAARSRHVQVQTPHYQLARMRVMQNRVQAHDQARRQRGAA